MISFLRGIIHDVGQGDVVIEVNGVGYRVSVHPKECSVLKKGDRVLLYTHYVLREDTALLIGFLTPEAEKFFRLLISASGIGPKTALEITGSASLNDFVSAVLADDIKALMRLPGVGKKTAQRILVELKDKIVKEGLSNNMVSGSTVASSGLEDAREALRGLGFGAAEVESLLQEAIRKKGLDADSDVLVKYVLQHLGG